MQVPTASATRKAVPSKINNGGPHIGGRHIMQQDSRFPLPYPISHSVLPRTFQSLLALVSTLSALVLSARSMFDEAKYFTLP
jgi:hypothetical protein